MFDKVGSLLAEPDDAAEFLELLTRDLPLGLGLLQKFVRPGTGDLQDRRDLASAPRLVGGDVDGHLDTIANIETSDQVKDAVGVRRAEIEG